ncbi:DUF2126 domain-containing protein [Nocardioides sp.]|uniref:transglutaminase family protein n=1 Tax=Nocardioides sp. TaxID=35761 RepID=UPI003D128B81
MTIKVAIEHRTTYTFDRAITVHPHIVRLRPAPHSRTPIAAYSLNISPAAHFINWQQDAFGNYLARLVFPEPVTELDITVDLVADMTVINPFDFFVEDYAERFGFSYPAGTRSDLEPYLRTVEETPGSGIGPLLRAWLDTRAVLPPDGMPIVDFLVFINQAVRDSVDYTVRMEAGVQTPDVTLHRALGSCRDSAWLLVAILRELGLAARFVSGYLVQLAPDEKPLDGPAGPVADFTDLHAWAEVYIPGAGWVGLDATSGLLAGEGHIPLSATPHPATSAPIAGAIDPAVVEFTFHNTVTRVHEDIRVTRPYSEEQWSRIDELGHRVDALLEAGDVRLTMGGEPTFVSADDTSTAQWNTDADGEEKRELALRLAETLKRRWAADGVVQHGQGKWYPGEPLPRWQIGLTWRSDGTPLWRDQSLLDTPWSPGTLTAEAAPAVVERMARAVAARLGVPDDFCLPAHEDRLHALWTEASRPAGEPPADDAEPHESGTGRFDAEPGEPAGWVVPVFRHPDLEGWGTARWRLRRAHLFLTPGTSPMGLRLPLSSLAWQGAPYEPDRSPFEARGDLSGAAEPVTPATELDIEDAPRTALSVEMREGHLFVFLPPLTHLEHAVELLGVVEAAAVEVGVPVVLEGYSLPGDPRTQTLTVTPDPGVIEVNVQPVGNWPELTHLVTTLYDDARATRLATEKFDLDGLHTGTGGGNHLTLGGTTPADSPLLRRPDLLRSLITFWQHHPALSYVFSGRFIGPTSQSPRVDEGRHETLYELEIAFAELDRVIDGTAQANGPDGQPLEPGPWLVDRLLRHLLTDITGNTHRSEFCIDKLYSPDSDRGRLGLLELRGFEMPPHARMALVQALLVRSLVARFWDEPYAGPLVRWGSLLHDRYLLPSFAAADLREVVADLNAHGIAFEAAWLDPFVEFRFPRIGETEVAGVHLELRSGVEPWHVLGEEVALGGTARYVDSSVEKIEVAASGLVEGRHVVTCNGVPMPMVPLADPAVPGVGFVGGVRYRAWAPHSALHPTIGVQSPLVFDVVDLWNERSLGGCTYHVVHPGGRSYERYPVNAMEAEARRAGRFVADGHTPGPVDVSAWSSADVTHGPSGGEYPCTLDLRRSGRMGR